MPSSHEIAEGMREHARTLLAIADDMDPPGSDSSTTDEAPKAEPVRRAGRGRRPGAVRTGVLVALRDVEGRTVDLEAVKRHLAQQGVRTTEGNLHQQMRRLTAAGLVARAGRGHYHITEEGRTHA